MYNNRDLMDRIVMEMDDDHVVIDASDIILPPFTLSFSEVYINKNSVSDFSLDQKLDRSSSEFLYRSRWPSFANFTPRQVDELNGFLSTPKFIKFLTDISESISKEENKKDALVKHLRMLNSYLPAAVYVPFVVNSIRNYAVLHIPPNECKIFQTKERCPFMICVEMYRPDEINRLIKEENAYEEEKQ